MGFGGHSGYWGVEGQTDGLSAFFVVVEWSDYRAHDGFADGLSGRKGEKFHFVARVVFGETVGFGIFGNYGIGGTCDVGDFHVMGVDVDDVVLWIGKYAVVYLHFALYAGHLQEIGETR